jgi:hypothetical protein
MASLEAKPNSIFLLRQFLISLPLESKSMCWHSATTRLESMGFTARTARVEPTQCIAAGTHFFFFVTENT